MPSKVVKSFAKRTGKSAQEVEAAWEKAKAIVSKDHAETDSSFYPRVVAILKKMIGLKEEYQFLDKFKKLLKD